MDDRAKFVDRLATAGATFSKHCRNCWTGEKTSSTLRIENFSGRQNDLYAIASLWIGGPLIEISSCADLDGVVYAGADGQHSWDFARWQKEIGKRVK